MRAGAALVQPRDRSFVLGPRRRRPQKEHLLQRKLALKDVAFGKPYDALDVRRCEHLPVEYRGLEIRRVFGERVDDAIAERFAAGIGPPVGITSTWRFFLPPGPSFPVGASPTSRTYPSIANSMSGEDYIGLLMGDVTGNWVPGTARPTENGSGRTPITVVLPEVAAPADTEIEIPVSVKGAPAGKAKGKKK